MIWFYGHILLDLDFVDCLEDGEPVPNAVKANLFELRMLDFDQHLSRELVLCGAVSWRLAGSASKSAYR